MLLLFFPVIHSSAPSAALIVFHVLSIHLRYCFSWSIKRASRVAPSLYNFLNKMLLVLMRQSPQTAWLVAISLSVVTSAIALNSFKILRCETSRNTTLWVVALFDCVHSAYKKHPRLRVLVKSAI